MNSFKNPKSFLIKPSIQKVLVIVIPHFVALIILILSYKSMPIGVTLLVLLLIIVSANHYFQLHILGSKQDSVTEIRQDSVNNWFILCNGNGNTHSDYILVNLLGTSFLAEFMIVINFEAELKLNSSKKSYTVLITPDSLTKDEFRHLKVRLKLLKT